MARKPERNHEAYNKSGFLMYRHVFFVITASSSFLLCTNMLCLHMKYLRGDTNEDDRERLGWIVAKTCAVLGKVYWNKRKTREHK